MSDDICGSCILLGVGLIIGLFAFGHWVIAITIVIVTIAVLLYFWDKMNEEREALEREYDKKHTLKVLNKITTKIAGTTMGNRQSNLKRIAKKIYGDDDSDSPYIDLIREPRNKHDPNAIKVKTDTGKELGYIKENLAKELAEMMDKGHEVNAYLSDILGYEDSFGDVREGPYGCELIITVYDKKV